MLEFDVFSDALESGFAGMGAAEAHGVLCGILSAECQQAGTRWLNEVLPDPNTASAELRAVLAEVFADTLRSLEDGQFDFMPLLPNDDEPLPVRAEALGLWGQGLLYGLGVSGLGDLNDRLPEDVREVISDFEQISRADSVEGGSEAEEAAFAELLEYMRVGVQLIYEELADLRGGQDEQVRH